MPTAIAPGRVNLIGDHTDYQAGWCLPMAINRHIRLTFHARDDTEVPDDPSHILRTVIQVLAYRGAVRGFDAEIVSDLPIGAGLSSSAALEVAATMAAASANGLHLTPLEVALVAQETEHVATGVPCGLMDQLACVFGRVDHALLLDCRSNAVTPVRLPDNARVTVVHSGMARTLAASAYAQRRAACETAAARLGLAALRDATIEQVEDDPMARHVVSENQRVLDFVAAMGAGDLRNCGALMDRSHASLRDDFLVSTPELDALVEIARAHGAFGARLTGAGFGGCIVALSPDDLTPGVEADYRAATGLEATIIPVRASDGARIEHEGVS
ncbi:MAG TPA: galactokinase family protein [Acidimicrobiia bacterium]|nr:galactokinase family protein [Acidimicrobiia bacterium]